jgi:putative oxygen-independent coproporphyrinogen III oxidase
VPPRVPDPATESPIRLVGTTRGAPSLAQLPPLGLYIHLPWCLRKCPYCDFNSHEWRGQDDALPAEVERRYIEALVADLESVLPSVWGRGVQTIFIGGGTPSLFSPDAIDALLAAVRARVRLAAQAEITLEANPGTFEAGRFAAFARAGVTRLSIGVQSFDDVSLRAIGRVHDGAQARAAVAEAARHFETFNIDLMYALPGQTLPMLERDLETALGFEPPHLSAYHLSLEPNTLFASRPPADLPDDDAAADMQSLIEARLADAGLRRYEVSAFARPGHRCRHNLNYWEFGDYLGIGAGAHAKISSHAGIVRQARLRHPQRYLDAALGGAAVETERRVTASELPFEFMLNALRLVDGVPAAMFGERTGLSLSAIATPLRRALDAGLLDPDPAWLRASPRGLDFLNDLQALFLASG